MSLVNFQLDTRCGAGRLCGRRVRDIDLNERRTFVTEKGNKTLSVTFTLLGNYMFMLQVHASDKPSSIKTGDKVPFPLKLTARNERELFAPICAISMTNNYVWST
jgi:hypothetical protein